jgi:hypothetical protein
VSKTTPNLSNGIALARERRKWQLSLFGELAWQHSDTQYVSLTWQTPLAG